MTSRSSHATSKPDWLPNSTVNLTTVYKNTDTTVSIETTANVTKSTTGSSRVSNLTVSSDSKVGDHTTESIRGVSSESYRTIPRSTVSSSETSPKARIHSQGG